MRGPPRRVRLNGGGDGKTKWFQGVDGHEICGKMCGSLGHFGDGVRDQALRPVPTIFDSVRR